MSDDACLTHTHSHTPPSPHVNVATHNYFPLWRKQTKPLSESLTTLCLFLSQFTFTSKFLSFQSSLTLHNRDKIYSTTILWVKRSALIVRHEYIYRYQKKYKGFGFKQRSWTTMIGPRGISS